jgi:hypothetical protein
MTKKVSPHPYTDKQALDRLLLLISTLVQYPGVGYSDSQSVNGNALQPVQQRLREVAAAMGIEFPEGYPAIPTIRKDMETLRHYGILDKRMYRWGLYLGELEEQQAELQGKLLFEKVKVRFFGQVMSFILEGDRRHPRQKVRPGPKDEITKDFAYVDYEVMLPPRALKEFILWVFKHANHAQVLSPPSLVEQHREALKTAAARYL